MPQLCHRTNPFNAIISKGHNHENIFDGEEICDVTQIKLCSRETSRVHDFCHSSGDLLHPGKLGILSF